MVSIIKEGSVLNGQDNLLFAHPLTYLDGTGRLLDGMVERYVDGLLSGFPEVT